MWLRKQSRDGNARGAKLPLGTAAALALALSVAGCGANYVENSAAAVLLVIQDINKGAPLMSDVRSGANGDTIINCQTTLTVVSRPKNPTGSVGPSQDVQITGYQVAYRRSDGRGAQGVDVPYTINGNISAFVASGGSSTTDVAIDIVRHQAKLEPPLSNINGLQLVTMFADVTLYGHTVSGQGVSADGSVQVTFADFGDGTKTCEGS
jgi:hypothetical protein